MKNTRKGIPQKSSIILVICFLGFINLNCTAQQAVFSRGEATTGNWWDGSNPWVRACDNWFLDRPDKNICFNWPTIGRNDVFIGHNNNNPMNVNGAWFQIRDMTIQPEVTIPRTYNHAVDAGLSFTRGMYNSSAQTQTFNVPIGVDAANVVFDAINGNLIFSQNFFLNANTASFIGTKTVTVSGAMQGVGNVLKTNTGLLVLTSASNSYSGSTTITAGVLRLNPVSNTTMSTQFRLNGGTLSTTGITSGRSVTTTGTLRLDASSTLELSTEKHSLTCANSSSAVWNGSAVLTIQNWSGVAGSTGTGGQIFLTPTGLTSSQLSQVNFTGYLGKGVLLPSGELVPRLLSFRTKQSGAWNTASTWEYTRDGGISWENATYAPTHADGSISIRSGHEVEVTTALTIDETTVQVGGILTLSANLTLNNAADNDLTVLGTIKVLNHIVGGLGDFSLGTDANLSTSHIDGIATSGSTGSFQNSGLRSFSTSANYLYNAAVLQATGSGLPASIKSLSIDNAAGVNLTSACTISNALLFTNGKLNTSSCNASTSGSSVLTMGDGASVSGASHLNYVNGILRKLGNDAFVFPIGNSSVYAPLEITAPSSNTDVFGACYVTGSPITAFGSTYPVGIHHVSNCEYWHLNRITGSSSVSVTLTWDTRSCGISEMNELRVSRWDGSSWVNLGNTSTLGSNTAGSVVSAPVDAFSPFTLASSTSNNPLPVTLNSFVVDCHAEKSTVSWSTASEFNASHFSVQKSRDGLNWFEVGVKMAAGTTSQTTDYQLEFEKEFGLSYYRLVQYDNDGQFEIFGPLSSSCFQNSDSYLLFPNPTDDVIQISFNWEKPDAAVSLYIFDGHGKVTNISSHEVSSGSNLISLDVSYLLSGNYSCAINLGAERIFSLNFVRK